MVDTDSNYEVPNSPYQHTYSYSNPDVWTAGNSWSSSISNLVYPGTTPTRSNRQGRVISGYLDPISIEEQRLGRGYIDMTATQKKEAPTENIYLELQNIDSNI